MAELRYLLGDILVARKHAVNLCPEPHPTFMEWPESQVSGDGRPLPYGFRRVVWNFEGQLVSASCWDTYQNLLGGDNYAIVYLRTRTPDISNGKYEYKVYRAIMSRPIGTPASGYRFKDVSLEFAIINEVTVGYPSTGQLRYPMTITNTFTGDILITDLLEIELTASTSPSSAEIYGSAGGDDTVVSIIHCLGGGLVCTDCVSTVYTFTSPLIQLGFYPAEAIPAYTANDEHYLKIALG